MRTSGINFIGLVQRQLLHRASSVHAAGADVLFEDPARRSTSVGVTVSPVRVASIEQFGDLQAVGKRLLDAERKKVRLQRSIVCIQQPSLIAACGCKGGACTAAATAGQCHTRAEHMRQHQILQLQLQLLQLCWWELDRFGVGCCSICAECRRQH
jgi:hypothetical protein